jgi:hypothetical protein
VSRGGEGIWPMYLYTCMKTEQRNLLKLFSEGMEGGEGEQWKG